MEEREVFVEYDQFIGTYINAVPEDTCDMIVDYIEKLNEKGFLFNRKHYERDSIEVHKKDLAFDVANVKPEVLRNTTHNTENAISFMLTEADPTVTLVNNFLVPAFDQYIEQYDSLKYDPLMSLYHKVQKTTPGGGYHVWHSEHGPKAFTNRVLAYTLYLNDVEEGGETEFLYQSKRVPARKGTISIFPAAFTHQHRGNPPLSGDKYIMTGWVQYANS